MATRLVIHTVRAFRTLRGCISAADGTPNVLLFIIPALQISPELSLVRVCVFSVYSQNLSLSCSQEKKSFYAVQVTDSP